MNIAKKKKKGLIRWQKERISFWEKDVSSCNTFINNIEETCIKIVKVWKTEILQRLRSNM